MTSRRDPELLIAIHILYMAFLPRAAGQLENSEKCSVLLPLSPIRNLRRERVLLVAFGRSITLRKVTFYGAIQAATCLGS